MGVALHTGVDVGLRVTQGLLLGDALVTGVFDGIRQHQVTQANAVDLVAAELAQVRRLLAGAQADAARAEQEAAVLRDEVAHAAARADRAEHALARVLLAIQA